MPYPHIQALINEPKGLQFYPDDPTSQLTGLTSITNLGTSKEAPTISTPSITPFSLFLEAKIPRNVVTVFLSLFFSLLFLPRKSKIIPRFPAFPTAIP